MRIELTVQEESLLEEELLRSYSAGCTEAAFLSAAAEQLDRPRQDAAKELAAQRLRTALDAYLLWDRLTDPAGGLST